MHNTINKLIAHALLLITASTMAFAQAIPDATITNSTAHYDVQADGRYIVEERCSLRIGHIDTPQAAKRFEQLGLAQRTLPVPLQGPFVEKATLELPDTLKPTTRLQVGSS